MKTKTLLIVECISVSILLVLAIIFTGTRMLHERSLKELAFQVNRTQAYYDELCKEADRRRQESEDIHAEQESSASDSSINHYRQANDTVVLKQAIQSVFDVDSSIQTLFEVGDPILYYCNRGYRITTLDTYVLSIDNEDYNYFVVLGIDGERIVTGLALNASVDADGNILSISTIPENNIN